MPERLSLELTISVIARSIRIVLKYFPIVVPK